MDMKFPFADVFVAGGSIVADLGHRNRNDTLAAILVPATYRAEFQNADHQDGHTVHEQNRHQVPPASHQLVIQSRTMANIFPNVLRPVCCAILTLGLAL